MQIFWTCGHWISWTTDIFCTCGCWICWPKQNIVKPCHMDQLSREKYSELIVHGWTDQRQLFWTCGCWISWPRQCMLDELTRGKYSAPVDLDQLTKAQNSETMPYGSAGLGETFWSHGTWMSWPEANILNLWMLDQPSRGKYSETMTYGAGRNILTPFHWLISYSKSFALFSTWFTGLHQQNQDQVHSSVKYYGLYGFLWTKGPFYSLYRTCTALCSST